MVCLACFASLACDGIVWESQSSTDLAKSDEGGIAAPSIAPGSRKPVKHVRWIFSSKILGGSASRVEMFHWQKILQRERLNNGFF